MNKMPSQILKVENTQEVLYQVFRNTNVMQIQLIV